jgi:hypothetical protein
MGGELPISGATVTMYSSALNSSIANGVYVGTATVLGTATSTTGADGSFSFSGITGCSASQIVYIVAAGGTSGVNTGSNANILNVAVLGYPSDANCDGLPSYSVVNEVTTVATAYAFSSFLSTSGSASSAVVNITAPANNASLATSNDVSSGAVTTASGLPHAYNNAINLANMATGSAYSAPPTNSLAIAPAAVVNTIANILQYCVNSASTGSTEGDGSPCGNLYAATPSQAVTYPTNTLQAAMNLARNPAANVSTVWGLAPSVGAAPFLPALSGAPNDWTLAIAYLVPPNPIGGVGFPFSVALDADDNVYVTSPENDPWAPTSASTSTTNSLSACLFGWTSAGAFRPTITPYVGTGDSIPTTGNTAGTQGTGTVGTSSWFCSGAQNGDTQKDYLLANLAADNVGNIWISNYGLGTSAYYQIVKVSTNSTLNPTYNPGSWEAQYSVPKQSGATVVYPTVGLIIDKFNNVWFNGFTPSTTSPATPNIIAFAAGSGSSGSTGSPLTIGTVTTGPAFVAAGRGLAFDSLGNFFGASYGGSSGDLNAQKLGGQAVILPLSGSQSVPGNYDTTALIKQVLGGAGTAASTGNNGLYGVAIDSSNNAWFTAGGAPGQTLTSGVVNGLFKAVPGGGTPYTTAGSSFSTINSTALKTPKFLEADGNNVLWIADSTGIAAYASKLGTPAFISEAGGFKPCIPSSGSSATCTYPDNNANTKGIAVDSTGSVWWTTPDLTTTNTNANMLIQMIGTGTSTWPLLAVQKPGTMPQ